MKYYIDIKLLFNSEISLGFIWQKVYLPLHLALVKTKDEDNKVKIGFSFPKYQDKSFPLGDVLRIFAPSKEDLISFDATQSLIILDEYISISEIKDVPSNVSEFVQFSRKQFKSSSARLARRQAMRKGISLEEALRNYEGMSEQSTKLPFVIMQSASSNQNMLIFIEKNISNTEIKGLFSTYGLSKSSTVPWF